MWDEREWDVALERRAVDEYVLVNSNIVLYQLRADLYQLGWLDPWLRPH